MEHQTPHNALVNGLRNQRRTLSNLRRRIDGGMDARTATRLLNGSERAVASLVLSVDSESPLHGAIHVDEGEPPLHTWQRIGLWLESRHADMVRADWYSDLQVSMPDRKAPLHLLAPGLDGVWVDYAVDVVTRLLAELGEPVDVPAPDSAGAPKKRRPRRTRADRTRDNRTIAAFLSDHPTARRDEVSKGTGIAGAHVSESQAWRQCSEARKEASRMNRARAIGGDARVLEEQARTPS